MRKAFADEGIELQTETAASGGEYSGIRFAPSARDFIVDRDADAERAFDALRSQRTNKTFDRRSHNVVVFADDGVTAARGSRVVAALHSLGED